MSDPRSRDEAVADLLEDLLLQEDIAAYEAMSAEQREATLKEKGFDDARTRAIAEKVRQDVAAPAANAAPPPKKESGGKVVDFSAEKAKRTVRWTSLLAVAAVFVFFIVGGGGAYMALRAPNEVPTSPTQRPEVPPQALVDTLKDRALRLCAGQYWGECWDALDELEKTSPKSKEDAAVQQARRELSDHFDGRKPQPPVHEYSKGHLGPGERPLQPTP